MSSNSVFLVILAASAVASLALHLASLRWGLRWATVARISFLKAFGLLIVFALTAAAVGSVLCSVLDGLSIQVSEHASALVAIPIEIVASCFLVAAIYKVRPLRAAAAILPYAAVSVITTLVALFLVRPFGYESFVVPTNSMAPTILGEHVQAPCPRCGRTAYGSPLERRQSVPHQGLLMICSDEHQAVCVQEVPPKVYEGDRILTCKFISPRRWDLIVFRLPENPSIYYVKRLIGLPNESLAIREGAVWINGERLEPPDALQGIQYSPTIRERGEIYSGPGSVPVKLGPDEYFVLGDFPERASDSRMWQQGAPGYPPYAVPESHLLGVVINIYWPPDRWTSFR